MSQCSGVSAAGNGRESMRGDVPHLSLTHGIGSCEKPARGRSRKVCRMCKQKRRADTGPAHAVAHLRASKRDRRRTRRPALAVRERSQYRPVSCERLCATRSHHQPRRNIHFRPRRIRDTFLRRGLPSRLRKRGVGKDSRAVPACCQSPDRAVSQRWARRVADRDQVACVGYTASVGSSSPKRRSYLP